MIEHAKSRQTRRALLRTQIPEALSRNPGVTQKKIAQDLGIAPSTLSKDLTATGITLQRNPNVNGRRVSEWGINQVLKAIKKGKPQGWTVYLSPDFAQYIPSGSQSGKGQVQTEPNGTSRRKVGGGVRDGVWKIETTERWHPQKQLSKKFVNMLPERLRGGTPPENSKKS
jgi:hypothetical protein